MEKRWCERIPVEIGVEIYHNGNKLGKCKVKNLSLRGICLVSGPIVFYKNTEIVIKFPDARYLSGNIDNINALVVRNSNGEIGLTFNPTIPEMISPIIRCTQNDNLKYATTMMQ